MYRRKRLQRRTIGPQPIKADYYSNNIALIQQFHIPKDTSRYEEIKDTLRRNSQNPKLSTIYLLNERDYTNEELGFSNETPLPSHIKQIVISKRLTYCLAFLFVIKHIQNTHVILSNNDIYYNDTIKHIPTLLHRKFQNQPKKAGCLLRWELPRDKNSKPYLLQRNKQVVKYCQDTWFFYSEDIKSIAPQRFENSNFPLGVLGCDNRIAYVFHKIFQFRTFNTPNMIQSYHNHRTEIRYYDKKNVIKGPYHYPEIIMTKPT